MIINEIQKKLTFWFKSDETPLMNPKEWLLLLLILELVLLIPVGLLPLFKWIKFEHKKKSSSVKWWWLCWLSRQLGNWRRWRWSSDWCWWYSIIKLKIKIELPSLFPFPSHNPEPMLRITWMKMVMFL